MDKREEFVNIMQRIFYNPENGMVGKLRITDFFKEVLGPKNIYLSKKYISIQKKFNIKNKQTILSNVY